MDQLSMPFRIVLVAVLAVGALYLVVFKPSGAPVPAATPVAPVAAPAARTATAPGVKGLTSAVDKARGAAAAQGSSDAATATAAETASETSTAPGAPVAIAPIEPASTAGTAPGTASKSAPAPAAVSATAAVKPAQPPADPSAPLLAALDRGRTVVVLFAGRTAVDDLAVRAALRRADRRGGRVDVHVVPLARVGDYEAITRGVQVQQSPTLLVIGKARQAREIVGFTTTREIDQLVADVRRG